MKLLEYRHGRIKAKEFYKEKGRKKVRVICDCGKTKEMRLDSFEKVTKSCGCLAKEVAQKQCSLNFKKHSLYKTHIHNVWRNMKERCERKANNRYYRYGGRGIKVKTEWSENIVVFYNWAIKNGYVVGMSLERLDNNKGYTENNCVWIPSQAQVFNKSTNYKILCKSESLNLRQFSLKHNFSLSSLYHFVERNNIPKIIKEETFLSQYLAKPRRKLKGRCND